MANVRDGCEGHCGMTLQLSMISRCKVLHDPEFSLLVHSANQLLVIAGNTIPERFNIIYGIIIVVRYFISYLNLRCISIKFSSLSKEMQLCPRERKMREKASKRNWWLIVKYKLLCLRWP